MYGARGERGRVDGIREVRRGRVGGGNGKKKEESGARTRPGARKRRGKAAVEAKMKMSGEENIRKRKTY